MIHQIAYPGENHIKTEIEFSGNASRISTEIIDRICALFLSTKNEGSGLRLSILKRLIEQPKSEILIKCVTGSVTPVTNFLPI